MSYRSWSDHTLEQEASNPSDRPVNAPLRSSTFTVASSKTSQTIGWSPFGFRKQVIANYLALFAVLADRKS